MNPQTIERARVRLEQMLNQAFVETEPQRKKLVEYYIEQVRSGKTIGNRSLTAEAFREALLEDRQWFYLPSEHPLILNRGSHQLVLDVGEGLVAKTSYGKRGTTLEIGRGRCDFEKESAELLTQMGIAVPKMHFLTLNYVNGKLQFGTEIAFGSFGDRQRADLNFEDCIEPPYSHLPNFYITPNLAEGGHRLVEYSAEEAEKLANGTALQVEFERHQTKLIQFREAYLRDYNFTTKDLRHGPYLFYNPHYDGKDDVKDAIRRMFHLQIDDKNEAKLLAVDIDHILVFN